jgi:hypothetical protein
MGDWTKRAVAVEVGKHSKRDKAGGSRPAGWRLQVGGHMQFLGGLCTVHDLQVALAGRRACAVLGWTLHDSRS